MHTTPRYQAFISYAHADERWASWLHRELEGYRLPKTLQRGEATRTDKMRPLFRDREELSASKDLSASIQQALAESSALIVLCSPAAVRSHWVQEEIHGFRALHPDRPILCAIVDGEPHPEAAAKAPELACLPQALTHRRDADGVLHPLPGEPLAADFRPQGDGKRLAKIKLIAGLLDVRLDDLLQRETQRRHQRMVWITSAAGIGMLVMSGLSLYAWQQRQRAERERVEAEGLIEYMIGDLRKKLDKVGRLEIMDSVGGRALDYYAKQDLEALSADDLGRRARALHLIGEIRHQRGQLEGAEEVFEQSSRSTAQLLARDPENPQRIFDHAQSVFWVGYTAWQRGEWGTAEEFFGKYRDQAQRLLKIDPDKREWQMEASYSGVNLGTVYFNQGRYLEAEAQFQSSLDGLTSMIAKVPNDAALSLEKAQVLAWLADAKMGLGQYEQVERLRSEELEIYRHSLLGDPKNRQTQYSISFTLGALGRAALARGDLQAAREHFQQALLESAELLKVDDSHVIWQQADLTARLGLAATQHWQGDAQASATAEAAEQQARAMLMADPDVVRNFLYLNEALQLRALQRATGGDAAGALEQLQGLERELMQRGAKDRQDRRFRELLADCLMRQVALTHSLGREGQSSAAAQRLTEALPAKPQSSRERWQRQLATAVIAGQEISWSSADAKAFRHPEVAFYRAAFAD